VAQRQTVPGMAEQNIVCRAEITRIIHTERGQQFEKTPNMSCGEGIGAIDDANRPGMIVDTPFEQDGLAALGIAPEGHVGAPQSMWHRGGFQETCHQTVDLHRGQKESIIDADEVFSRLFPRQAKPLYRRPPLLLLQHRQPVRRQCDVVIDVDRGIVVGQHDTCAGSRLQDRLEDRLDILRPRVAEDDERCGAIQCAVSQCLRRFAPAPSMRPNEFR